MDDGFESFNENDDEWLSELETRAMNLENDLFDWRDSRARAHAESSYGRDASPHGTRDARDAGFGEARTREARTREILRVARRERPAGHDPGPAYAVHTAAEPGLADHRGHHRPAEERTQILIDRGRRNVKRTHWSGPRKLTIVVAGLAVVVTVSVMILFRKGPSWPPSVATVQSEITTACQNPNIVSEPGQINFACGKGTSQILWVFALMTSNNNPAYTDAKTGRKGLEPITATQGGEVAWSLNLHHPYNPYNPIDSLEVAARAINNIIGGATLTSANGSPNVQPGLESNPANCARYTGSSAVISHAGFPSLCAQPVTTQAGQAALVADVYQEWLVGATQVAAQDVSVLFQNADNPGNPQVQAILKTLP